MTETASHIPDLSERELLVVCPEQESPMGPRMVQLVELNKASGQVRGCIGELNFNTLYITLCSRGIIRQVPHPSRSRYDQTAHKGDRMTSDVITLPTAIDPKSPVMITYAVITPGATEPFFITDTESQRLDKQLEDRLLKGAIRSGEGLPNSHRELGPELVSICLEGNRSEALQPVIDVIVAQTTWIIQQNPNP